MVDLSAAGEPAPRGFTSAYSAIWPYGRHAQRHFLCLLAQLWLTRFKIGSQNRTPSLPESDNTDPRKPT
jgi:hypothetical protein